MVEVVQASPEVRAIIKVSRRTQVVFTLVIIHYIFAHVLVFVLQNRKETLEIATRRR